jgi:hypothetical protein
MGIEPIATLLTDESETTTLATNLPAMPSAAAMSLPSIINASALLADTAITIPQEVICGVLHKGCKMVLGANSKSRKTWTLIDLAISVSTGTPFWNWHTNKGRVLIIDFELHVPFLKDRLQAVAHAKGIDDLSGIDIWPLRGKATALDKLAPLLRQAVSQGQYNLVILDPVYKLMGGKDENSAGVIGDICNQLEAIISPSGTALAYAAHFAKGNASGKEAIDRISGSGATGRDADTILTLTKHQTEGAFSVELTLRNHPEQPSFVVAWDYPLMSIREELDATQLKQAKDSRKSTKSKVDVMPHVPPGKPIRQKVLMSKLQTAEFGINKAQGFIEELVEDGLLFKWHQKRNNAPPEVLYARDPQPEPELATVEDIGPE